MFLSFGQHSIPVLDEESYWKIASQMSWGRPYDWKMPWFPFEERGFVYAHPPLFLYWVKLVQSFAGMSLAQWILGVPFQALFLFSAHQVLRTFLKPQNYWYALVLLLSSTVVYLPLTRSLMPDLMVCSIASYALWRWLAAADARAYFLAGLMLGIASWVKYPALILFLLPLLSDKKGSFLWFFVGGMGIFLLGELWLWSMYGDVHLIEVLRRAPEIPRSSFTSRGVGIVNRLGVSLFPLSLLVFLKMSKRAFVFGAIGSAVSLFYAAHLDVPSVLYALPFGALGGAVLSSLRLQSIWSFWALLVLLGVWIGHNYASPRYWILLSMPLLIQEIKGIRLEKKHWGIALPALLSLLVIVRTEFLQAREASRLAEEFHAVSEYNDAHFTGEWSFRWKMEALGYSFIGEEKSEYVLWARNSAGGVEAAEYFYVDGQQGERSWFSLVNDAHSVGYYADSLGYFPLWIGKEPLEVVELWKKK